MLWQGRRARVCPALDPTQPNAQRQWPRPCGKAASARVPLLMYRSMHSNCYGVLLSVYVRTNCKSVQYLTQEQTTVMIIAKPGTHNCGAGSPDVMAHLSPPCPCADTATALSVGMLRPDLLNAPCTTLQPTTLQHDIYTYTGPQRAALVHLQGMPLQGTFQSHYAHPTHTLTSAHLCYLALLAACSSADARRAARQCTQGSA